MIFNESDIYRDFFFVLLNVRQFFLDFDIVPNSNDPFALK